MTLKVRKPELSFMYVTHCLVLFYISTKYHQTIPKKFYAETEADTLQTAFVDHY